MSTQELLTYLFNAIALGFTIIAAMDFALRLVAAHKQVSPHSSSPLTSTQQPSLKLPLVTIPQVLSQLPDPWLLPLPAQEAVGLIKLVQKEPKHLRLLPPARETSMAIAPNLEELLLGISIDKMKLRQARKIAKVLGIAQKVNGRDQKLAFLVGQIKSNLQQAKAEIIELVRLTTHSLAARR
jgi:hypothetical protein